MALVASWAVAAYAQAKAAPPPMAPAPINLQCTATNTPANDAGFQYWYQNFTSGLDGQGAFQAVCGYTNHASWLTDIGSKLEQDIAVVCQ